MEIKKKPGRPSKKTVSYEKKGKEKAVARPSTPRNVTFEDETRRIIQEEPIDKQDEEMQDTSTSKLRQSKVYRFNAWQKLKDMQVLITFEELAQLSLTIK